MATPAIVEKTEDELVVQYSDRVWRPVQRTITVPDTLSGKYVTAVAVVTDVQLNDAQEATLEAAVEAITGVQLAKVLVGASRLSHDRLPADTAENTYDLRVGIRMGIDAVEVPVEVPVEV